jgi:macrocin-O-methyltransferase TylF-like protien
MSPGSGRSCRSSAIRRSSISPASGPIAFALLDGDLYVPVAAILPKLYENLSPEGIILVDDLCRKRTGTRAGGVRGVRFKSGMAHPIMLNKLGVIAKP